MAAISALIVVAAVIIAVAVSSGRHATTRADMATEFVTGPQGPEAVPLEQGALLAPATTAAMGQTIDNVQCGATEEVAYHVHTHLSVYVDGRLRPIPAGIGIVTPIAQPTANGPFYEASKCYYWLHVHAQDGVIHIESPAGYTYNLGQFFDIWKQPLSPGRVGPATGNLSMFVNGRTYRGDPRDIQLGAHEDIQIDVGTPAVAPMRVNWSVTSL